MAHYVERDSTYGWMHAYLYGHQARSLISDIDEKSGSMRIDGLKVVFLRERRNPAEIGWGDLGVALVVDTTGQFLDPTLPVEHAQGSVRGHLECGAQKVVVSAPFKIKDKAGAMPPDAVTTVMGINDHDYDPRRHHIVSNASCTTTCLAHMMKPLIDAFGARRILSASMATVHAATGSQEVLDRLPGPGKTDLRKNRSIMNNIILTSTGAAKALRLVIPEMEDIGFIAESVRIPTSTGSLIILVVNVQEEPSGDRIDRQRINAIYRQAAAAGARRVPDVHRAAERVRGHRRHAPGGRHHRGARNPHPHRRNVRRPGESARDGTGRAGRDAQPRHPGARDPGGDLRLVRQRDGQLRPHARGPYRIHSGDAVSLSAAGARVPAYSENP